MKRRSFLQMILGAPAAAVGLPTIAQNNGMSYVASPACEETHVLRVCEMPSHSHSISASNDPSHTHSFVQPCAGCVYEPVEMHDYRGQPYMGARLSCRGRLRST